MIGKISKVKYIELGNDRYFERYGGGTPKKSQEEYWNKGTHYWLSNSEIQNDKINYINHTKHKITDEGLKNSSATLIPKNSVLLTCTASIGKVAINKTELTTNQQFNSFYCKKDILPKYLAYYLLINKEKLLNLSGKTSFLHITISSLKKFKIPVPPIETQKEIISILEKTENLKEKRKNINEDTEKIIQSIFYEMFGDPVKNEKGWEVKNFEEVCIKLFAGGDVPKNNFSKEKNSKYEIPIYSNGTKDKALYGYTNIEKVQEDSVTISARGTIGTPIIREAPFYPIIRLIVATPDKNCVNITYLKEAISFFNFNKIGSSIPQLTVPTIKKNKILVPPLELQNEFEKKIKLLESIKDKQKSYTLDINTLFDALMQKSFKRELGE